MTDETFAEGNQSAPTGGTESPTSSPSGKADSQPSNDFAAVQQRLDALEKLYKGVQKGNDRINARVEEKVNNIAAQIGRISELTKAGKSPDEIEERLLLDEILAERKGKTLSTQPEGNGERGQGTVEVQDIARKLNLDVNDVDIAKAVASGDLVNVMKVAMSKAAAPTAGVEDNPLATGGGQRPAGVAELTNKYITEMRNARGNRKLLSSLREQYKAKGVDVYSVDFS
jgi:hypothetical protein